MRTTPRFRSSIPRQAEERIDTPRRLLSVTPYSRGLEHGIARQWGEVTVTLVDVLPRDPKSGKLAQLVTGA